MSGNGRLTSKELVSVQTGIELSLHAAYAYLRAKAFFAKQGLSLTIAKPIGGYRSYFVQGDMHVHPGKYGLNPNSKVAIATAGYSSHGWGTRVDLLINGSSWPQATHLKWLAKFGFTREFGAADPNHFKHDGRTAIGRIIAKVVRKK